MLRDLRISNFRGLREFAMSGLGRVNLLVGTNNCGKTSVLEAIHVLSAPGTAGPLWLAQGRRGETIDNTSDRQVDVAHLVHGHKLAAGSGFQITGHDAADERSLVAKFLERRSKPIFVDGDDGDNGDADVREFASANQVAPLTLSLEWSGPPGESVRDFVISRRGGLGLGFARATARRPSSTPGWRGKIRQGGSSTMPCGPRRCRQPRR